MLQIQWFFEKKIKKYQKFKKIQKGFKIGKFLYIVQLGG
jgi:hypothetical protein